MEMLDWLFIVLFDVFCDLFIGLIYNKDEFIYFIICFKLEILKIIIVNNLFDILFKERFVFIDVKYIVLIMYID